MSAIPFDDVFTADEVARAAGVPLSQAQELLANGDGRPSPRTQFLTLTEAVRAGRQLRAAMAQAPSATPARVLLTTPATPTPARKASKDRAISAVGSGAVHGMLLVLALLASARGLDSASGDDAAAPTHLVFLAVPGPGGGGGGGGLRNPLPSRRIERPGVDRRTAPEVRNLESRPVTVEREPLPSKPLSAPIAAAAANSVDRPGELEAAKPAETSQGPGVDGGAGSGRGGGLGEGSGDGVGPGTGGGYGGGVYRPGAGIEPPRLLKEVKAEYTEDARRRGITGSVVLEIVVQHDGRVGDVNVVHGLGSGLNERAVQAVRQWRFDPARRQGAPVDVLVEVAVEFILR